MGYNNNRFHRMSYVNIYAYPNHLVWTMLLDNFHSNLSNIDIHFLLVVSHVGNTFLCHFPLWILVYCYLHLYDHYMLRTI